MTQASARPFIHSLNILVKYVRLYGFAHKRTQTQFEVAWAELKDALPVSKGSFVLGVAGDRLLLDGFAIEAGQAERGFAQLLTASGLASIQFCSDIVPEEFEKLVRAFAFNGAKAQDLADQIKSAFAGNKGNIRVNEVKFVISDAASANMTAAAQIVAQSLGPEFKDWLNDPNKLIQVIAAAEGAHNPKTGPAKGTKSEEGSWSNSPYLLNSKEIQQAMHLLTRFGELTTVNVPKPELIGSELDKADDKIKNSVLM